VSFARKTKNGITLFTSFELSALVRDSRYRIAEDSNSFDQVIFSAIDQSFEGGRKGGSKEIVFHSPVAVNSDSFGHILERARSPSSGNCPFCPIVRLISALGSFGKSDFFFEAFLSLIR